MISFAANVPVGALGMDLRRNLRRVAVLAAVCSAVLVAVEAGCRLFFLYRNRLQPREDFFELYAIGGSTMAGSPYDGILSIPGIASNILGGEVRGKPIRVLNLAGHGESIYPQAFSLKDAVRYRDRSRPGAVFVYSGHNDAAMGRARLSPGCRVYEPIKEGVLSRSAAVELLMFYGEKGRILPACRDSRTFERYMREAVKTALAAGLRPVLSTVISNVAEIEPGLVLGGPSGLTRDRLDSLLAQGERLERQGKDPEAIRFYERAGREFPDIGAYLRYRIGACLRRMGEYGAANRAFWEAIDSAPGDAFGRATSGQNALIRDLARRYGVPLVDAVRMFEEHSPHGLVGDGLLIDGHHPNDAGYALLAGGFAQALARDLGLPRKDASASPVAHTFPDGAGDARPPAWTASPDEMARWFPMTKEARIESLLRSGRWLFTISARHAHPADRLGLAEKRFREALALEPGLFSAWLGLGLVTAARETPSILLDDQDISWLDERGLFYGSTYDLPRDKLPEVLARLSLWGVPDGVLERIRAGAPKML
ncbi:MAG: hypothetical protein HY748_00565 [Elusimicrobia bacterium]|nr:hypothetical protein [Elusimicrobiota bacterium]